MKEYKIKINGNHYKVAINTIEDGIAEVEVNGTPYKVELENQVKKIMKPITRPAQAPTNASGAPVITRQEINAPAGALKSPLPGVILDILVKVGDGVKKGQKIAILEAMKMENQINADRDGKIIEIKVSKGESVLEGAPIVVIG